MAQFPVWGYSQIQDQYLKATLSFKDGSSKEGFIKNQPSEKMCFSVRFKADMNEKGLIVYDTSSVNKIFIENGERYDLLRFKPHFAKDSIGVLAKKIVDGKASLYIVIYRLKEIYIILNNGKKYPLQDEEILDGENKITSYYFNDYLKIALSDDDSLFNVADKALFNERALINIIVAYNRHQQAECTVIKVKEESKHFLVVTADKSISNTVNSNSIFTVQGMYRTYLIKDSRNTCIELGFRYWSRRYNERVQIGSIINGIPQPGYINTMALFKENFFAIPFTIQHNLLNKWLRPYVFLSNVFFFGYNRKNNVYEEINTKGFGDSYGFFFTAGGGVELDICKGIMLKTDYRLENKLWTLGIGYHYLRK